VSLSRMMDYLVGALPKRVDPKRAARFNAYIIPCTYETEMDQLNRQLRAQLIGPEDYKRKAAQLSKFYGR
jgi:hypothetical protein